MVTADGWEAIVADAHRHDARHRLPGRTQRQMHRLALAPQAEQVAAALAQRLADGAPGIVIDLVARPRPVPGDRGAVREQAR